MDYGCNASENDIIAAVGAIQQLGKASGFTWVYPMGVLREMQETTVDELYERKNHYGHAFSMSWLYPIYDLVKPFV